MQPGVSLEDLLPAPEFVRRRPWIEAEVLAAKRNRRVKLGEHLTFLFENRATVLWQIHEMCRVEQISDPAAIQHEVDTYAALLPGASELSATLLIEYEVEAERNHAVRQLVGLHQQLWIAFSDGSRAAFRLDAEQFSTERVSSVQFARAALSPAQLSALANLNEPVELRCTHAFLPCQASLTFAQRVALLDDLAGLRS